MKNKTDLETAARKSCAAAGISQGTELAAAYETGFEFGAAHNQKRIEELEYKLNEAESAVRNYRKLREEWHQEITKEREISKMLEDALNLALALMKFTDSLDIADAATNSPTIALCSGYIVEVQKLRGK